MQAMDGTVKRIFDLSLALPLAVVLSPLMLLLAALVRLYMGAPALYRQLRPGLNGRPFVIYKFRTMKDALDADGRPLPDSERLTPFGRFLRGTSLDELPELINVIKGTMSLVGPRPLVMEYLPYYTEREMLRHSIRPGITGWAQVNGRNAVSWDERLKLDLWYVEHASLFLDIRIILKTIITVFRRDGLSIDPRSAMPDFDVERRASSKGAAYDRNKKS